MTSAIPVERLVGREVYDPRGHRVGRIEELAVRWTGGACLVEEIHLGPAALLERLAGTALLSPLLRLFGKHPPRQRRVPWAELDLRDPTRPVLRGPARALRSGR
jgi:sporulation protein YlmC with PRC-barrel domain